MDLGAGAATGGDDTDSLTGIANVVGSDHPDVITGNGGPNLVNAQAGDDHLDGAGGSDSLDFEGASAGEDVDLAAGSASGGDGTDTFTRFENVDGSDFGDNIAGDPGPNNILGGPGNDQLGGGGGIDTVDYLTALSAVNVDLSTGTASGGDGNDAISGFEDIDGSRFDDTLTGDGGLNTFMGRGGADRIDGGGGVLNISDYSTAPSSMNVNLATGNASGRGRVRHPLRNPSMTAQDSERRLVGMLGSNLFLGRGGNDAMDGAGSQDTVNYRAASPLHPSTSTSPPAPPRVKDKTPSLAWRSSLAPISTTSCWVAPRMKPSMADPATTESMGVPETTERSTRTPAEASSPASAGAPRTALESAPTVWRESNS